jgi:hypothetical protein
LKTGVGATRPGVRIPPSPPRSEEVAVTRRPLLFCVAVLMAISPSVLDLCWIVVPDMVQTFLDRLPRRASEPAHRRLGGRVSDVGVKPDYVCIDVPDPSSDN